VLDEVDQLVPRATLHLDSGPGLEGLPQPGVTIHDEQQRGGQPAPLGVDQDAGPVAGRLAGRQPQRDQHLRAVLRHPQHGQHGNAHDPARQADLEIQPVQEQNRVALGRKIPLIPTLEQPLEPRDHPGDRALGQVLGSGSASRAFRMRRLLAPAR